MRQFRPQTISKLKIEAVIKKTPKAYLVKISSGVSTWIPKYMVKNFPAKNLMNIYNKYADEVRINIKVEKLANMKKDTPKYRRRKNKEDEWKKI